MHPHIWVVVPFAMLAMFCVYLFYLRRFRFCREMALVIYAAFVGYHGRFVVGEDARKYRQIAGAISKRTSDGDDGRLAFRHAVKITHGSNQAWCSL